MNEMLKALYDSFYEKLPATQLKRRTWRIQRPMSNYFWMQINIKLL